MKTKKKLSIKNKIIKLTLYYFLFYFIYYYAGMYVVKFIDDILYKDAIVSEWTASLQIFAIGLYVLPYFYLILLIWIVLKNFLNKKGYV